MIILLVSELAQLVKNLPAMQETLFDSWARKTPWRRDRLPTSVVMGFSGGLDDKESTCNVGVDRPRSIPGLERSPGGGHGNPLQYSFLENPYGQKSLQGYSPWGCKESDRTERLKHIIRYHLIVLTSAREEFEKIAPK